MEIYQVSCVFFSQFEIVLVVSGRSYFLIPVKISSVDTILEFPDISLQLFSVHLPKSFHKFSISF